MAPLVWAASKSPFLPQQPFSENSTSARIVSNDRPKMQFASPSIGPASLNEKETIEVPRIAKVESDPHDTVPDDTTGSLSMPPQGSKRLPSADGRPSEFGRKVGIPTTTRQMLPVDVPAGRRASVKALAGDHASLVHTHKPKHLEPDGPPLVRNVYTGPHVILICPALTKAQKRQAGCL
jgi:hypothetical protein